jgi:glycosyltransferase involved in cell wall biosynthesis
MAGVESNLGIPDGQTLGAARASSRHAAQPSIAVILPAYNEELTVVPTIRAFHDAVPEATIVVIDNNSSDGTASLAAEALQGLGCPTRLIHEPRQGKGHAVRRAFFEVEADVYLLADADLTYPAARARDLISPIAEGRADMVVGDRHADGRYSRENRRRFHGFGNRLVQRTVNLLFRSQLHDIMSGYRSLSGLFVENYPILVEGFQIETDMTLHALDKRFRIEEVPIEYQDRPSGSRSKLNTFADGRRVLMTIARLVRHYRPLLFFTILATGFGLLGLLAGVPVLMDWVMYEFIYRVPLAVLATGLMILSGLSLGIGLILDSVVHVGRASYEKDLLHRARSRHRDQP